MTFNISWILQKARKSAMVCLVIIHNVHIPVVMHHASATHRTAEGQPLQRLAAAVGSHVAGSLGLA